MLQLLQSCPDLHLIKLELEYRIDDDEEALLKYLAQTFTTLQILEIYRYRPEDSKSSPMYSVRGVN